MKLLIEVDIEDFEMYHNLAESKESQEHCINECISEMITYLGDYEKFNLKFSFTEGE